VIAGIRGRMTGKADKPPSWLVEILASERLARTELEKKIDQVSADAQAAVNLLAEQLNAQELRHKEELDRLAQTHKGEREQLLEQLGRQQGHIEYMRRAAEQATGAAVAQHTAIGALEEGLKEARERLTRQRVIADGRYRETLQLVERARNDMRFLLAEFAALDADYVAAVPGAASRLAKIRGLIDLTIPTVPPAPPVDDTYEDA
jgi:hypothetical protein